MVFLRQPSRHSFCFLFHGLFFMNSPFVVSFFFFPGSELVSEVGFKAEGAR